MNALNKPLPHSLEAEKSVLSSIMLDNKSVFKAMAQLSESDLFSKKHQSIFKVMKELAGEEKVIDFLTMSEKFRSKGEADFVDLISELEDFVPTSHAIEHHIGIVKNKAILRGLIKTGYEFSEKAWQGEDLQEIIEEAQNRIYDFSLRQSSSIKAKHVFAPKEWGQSAHRLACEWMENPSAIRGIATGMPRLDLTLRGLKDLNIISASTGVGKTALGINWAVNIGIRQKIPCLYLNYEMNLDELGVRAQSILSGIPVSIIFSGKLSENFPYKKIVAASDLIQKGKLFISGNQPKTITTTISLIHQYKAQQAIKVVFIDYLGEIAPDKLSEKESSEYMTFGRWAQLLKNVCTSLGVKLVLLAQLNRDGEDNPKMSRVGGSWKIAQKADVFLIIKQEKNDHCLWIAKNRNGKEKFGIDIDFDKETQRIVELTDC